MQKQMKIELQVKMPHSIPHKEREAKQELRRRARTLPQVYLGQGCWVRETGENMGSGMGFHSTLRAEWVRD